MTFTMLRCVRRFCNRARTAVTAGTAAGTGQQTTLAGLYRLPPRSVSAGRSPVPCACFSTQTQRQETIMNVFDRKTKRMQRNQTASLKDYAVYDYIKDEMGWRMADRISDINRTFPVAADVGCGRGHISKHILKGMVGTLYQCDMAEKILEQSAVSPEVPTIKVHCDEEFFPFRTKSLDLVVSSMSLHWVNDLPGVFKQIQAALKPDGCFMGAMFGGDTLFELRVALQLAEQEIEGGVAAHISPFTSVQDLGNLLNRAGYAMLTIDVDELVINYPSVSQIMKDIKGMGESNCAWSRKLRIKRATLKRAEEIYKEMYGKTLDGVECFPATFHVLNFIGWTQDKSQAQPAKRGSGQVSIKDIGKLDQLTKQIEDLKSQTQGSEGLEQSMGHLADQLRKLKEEADRDLSEPDDDDKKK